MARRDWHRLCVNGTGSAHEVVGTFITWHVLSSAIGRQLGKTWEAREAARGETRRFFSMAEASQPERHFDKNARADARPLAAAAFNDLAKSSLRALCSSRLARASQHRGTVRRRHAPVYQGRPHRPYTPAASCGHETAPYRQHCPRIQRSARYAATIQWHTEPRATLYGSIIHFIRPCHEEG